MDRKAKIAALAKQMGVTERDVEGFVMALSVWVNKGLTFEQAIERHMKQMTRLAERSLEIDARAFCVEAFFPSAA